MRTATRIWRPCLSRPAEVLQGVTTEVVGNCGLPAAPLGEVVVADGAHIGALPGRFLTCIRAGVEPNFAG